MAHSGEAPAERGIVGMTDNIIFVFGSNLAGRHGKGAALYAKQHYGAQRGVGEGLIGRAYAIPTKGHSLEVLPLDQIKVSIQQFADFAQAAPNLTFILTPIGCGLAGYKVTDILPLVEAARMPENVKLSVEWDILMGVVRKA